MKTGHLSGNLGVACLLLAGAAACGGGDKWGAAPEPPRPKLGQTRQVVPGAGLPAEVEAQNANNNLDVAEYAGRVYLAFRTSKSHFAGTMTVIYVVSSADERQWDFEAEFALGTDLREPRLLAWDGKLFLYISKLGQSAVDFEPHGVLVSQYQGPGDWSAPEDIYQPGFLAWRTKTIGDTPYMLGYIGGENIYNFTGGNISVHWLTTQDGRQWTPVVPDQPEVLHGGNSETDLVIMDDGAVVAVSRDEEGDEMGFGMKICRAEAESWGDWNCLIDPKKYDSPLLFRHRQKVYLIGRRNLTETGNYDLGHYDLDATDQTATNLLDYSMQPKRCSLWEVDPKKLTVTWVLDLPSKGDTCFPALRQQGPHDYAVYNYSSPLDGPDVTWIIGQTGLTNIYRTELYLP